MPSTASRAIFFGVLEVARAHAAFACAAFRSAGALRELSRCRAQWRYGDGAASTTFLETQPVAGCRARAIGERAGRFGNPSCGPRGKRIQHQDRLGRRTGAIVLAMPLRSSRHRPRFPVEDEADRVRYCPQEGQRFIRTPAESPPRRSPTTSASPSSIRIGSNQAYPMAKLYAQCVKPVNA